MLYGMPGIDGGGLGQCALCGKDFIKDIMGSMCGTGSNIRTITVNGIDGELCVHGGECLEKLEALQGAPWEDLPPGPLRRAFEQGGAE